MRELRDFCVFFAAIFGILLLLLVAAPWVKTFFCWNVKAAECWSDIVMPSHVCRFRCD